MAKKLFFIAGLTGHVGGAAARQLLSDGHAVRALVRNPQKAAEFAQQNVDLRQGDFTDSAALASALEGVDGAFLMVPPNVTPQPGYPESVAVINAIREAVHKMPPPHAVVLSSIGSEQTHSLGLITATHLLEQALKDVSFPVTFIRAGSFHENALGGLAGAAATGTYFSFYQPVDRPVPMIATKDIGLEVARNLTKADPASGIIELGTLTTPNEVAAAMGKVLGKDVMAQAIPPERWAATFESFGMPPGSSWAYEEMLNGVNSGWIHFGVPGTQAIPATTTATQVFAGAEPGLSH